MYLSLIPQFVDPDAGRVLLQGLALGGIQVLVSVTVHLVLVLAAGTVAAFLAGRPSWLRVLRYAMGTVLGTLALDHSRPAAAT